DVEMACEVHGGEQQVAELVEHAMMVGFGVQLGQFLVDLSAWATLVGPVEADASCAALQLGRAFKRRKGERDARQGALIGICRTFLGLDDLPEVVTAMLGVAEDVWMAALHLV